MPGNAYRSRLHLGHYVGSLENRVRLREEYDCYPNRSTIVLQTDVPAVAKLTEYCAMHAAFNAVNVGLAMWGA